MGRLDTKISRRSFAFIGWTLPCWMAVCGCSGNPPQYTSGEKAAVQEAISSFPDSASDVARKAGLFVEGAAPDADAMKPFEAYAPSAGKVSISGNMATVNVEFEELATGKITGPVEWTLEKVDGEWKFKTYPTP